MVSKGFKTCRKFKKSISSEHDFHQFVSSSDKNTKKKKKMVGEVPLCFCGVPARKTTSRTNGKVFYNCGVDVDYAAISKVDKIRDLKHRQIELEKINMGCNLKMSEEDLILVYQVFECDIPKMTRFPTCYHDLFAKLCVSHSRQNMGRPFFACNVPLPNHSCGYFKWCSDFIELNKVEPASFEAPPSSNPIKEEEQPAATLHSPWIKN